MALSPNYNWSEPDNSSLVKNGAQDIRALGDAIDTSVWNVGYGQAGKNKIINGDFGIWQRGTSQSVTSNAPAYGSADRWAFSRNGTEATGTNTISRETFTVGQTDVPNNPTYYCRWTTTTLGTSQTRIDVNQYVENVSSFAGQTVTLSFYVKSSGTFAISTFLEQNFGSGGSTTVTTTAGTGNTSTSWQRFTTTVAIPSITGKTVGASNYLRILIRISSPTAGATFDFANAQLEYGSKATPFQTATGNIQSELAACQRYYYRFASEGKTYASFNIGGYFESSIKYIGRHQHPVAMRTNPTTLDFANLSVIDTSGTFYAVSAAAIDTNTNTTLGTMINFTVSGATTSRFGSVLINNNTGAFLGIGAEL